MEARSEGRTHTLLPCVTPQTCIILLIIFIFTFTTFILILILSIIFFILIFFIFFILILTFFTFILTFILIIFITIFFILIFFVVKILILVIVFTSLYRVSPRYQALCRAYCYAPSHLILSITLSGGCCDLPIFQTEAQTDYKTCPKSQVWGTELGLISTMIGLLECPDLDPSPVGKPQSWPGPCWQALYTGPALAGVTVPRPRLH